MQDNRAGLVSGIGRLLLALVLAGCSASLAAGPVRASERAASLVIDVNSGKVLHEDRADALRYPASLTKIMTLYLLFETLQAGRLTLDSELVVTERAAAAQPSKLGLDAGDKIKVSDAIKALVTKSANDVAITVAENLAGTEQKFARHMTTRARELGMRNTTFRNASGLPDPEQRSTARDMAVLALRLYDDFPKYYPYFKTGTFTYAGKRYRNHNGLLHSYEGTDGIKTGYTRASGFNLVASVRRDGRHLIGVVLGGDTAGKRDSRMRSLLSNAFAKASTRKTRTPAGSELMALVQPPKQARRSRDSFTEEGVSPSGLSKVAPSVTDWTVEVVPHPVEVARAGDTTEEVGSSEDDAVFAAFAASAPAVMTGGGTGTAKVAAKVPTAAVAAAGDFHVQVGAFGSEAEALQRLAAVKTRLPDLLGPYPTIAVVYATAEKTYYRARFAGFDQAGARRTCQDLKKQSIDCVVMKAQ